MSTRNERLEATIWLDSNVPDLPANQRAKFLGAAAEYYKKYPIKARRIDLLASLRRDHDVFAQILRSIQGDEERSGTAGEIPETPDS